MNAPDTASFSLVDLMFYGMALVTFACGVYAVFSRNIVRAVFSLLGTFLPLRLVIALSSGLCLWLTWDATRRLARPGPWWGAFAAWLLAEWQCEQKEAA